MSDLPDPLTPFDCDIRDYRWLRLDVRRLLTSETWVLGSPEEKCAAMTLYCESYHQVPAASLPDNDRMLAHLSMAGASWPEIRDEVMKSWVKCSDGRLYHPVVAEKANEAWQLKLAQKQRTKAARTAKAERSASKMTNGSGSPVTDTVAMSVIENETENVTEPVATSVTENVTSSTVQDSTRQDQESKKDPSLRSGDGRARKTSIGRGTRLPEDWQPSINDVTFAQIHALDLDAVAAKFRDYWHAKSGKDGVKADWEATWRNWCRNEVDRRIPGFRTTGHPSKMAWMAEEARAEQGADSGPIIDMPAGGWQ